MKKAARISVGVLVAGLLTVVALTTAPPAAAAVGVHVVGTPDCGYEAATNTFRPVVKIQRAFADDSTDQRASVLLRLSDGDTPTVQHAQLATGVTDDAVQQNGAFPVPIGLERSFTPEAGAVFGDGGGGGSALTANHDYLLNVRLLDFSSGEFLVVGPFQCRTVAVPCDHRVLFVEHDGEIPGVHLFDFDTLVRYEVCDDGTVTFKGGDGTQLIDFGWTTLGLELLGFPISTGVVDVGGDTNPNPAIAEVPISGRFNVEFDWAGVIGNKLGGKVGEKLAKTLLKRLEKAPRPQWTSIVLGEVDATINALRRDADKIDQWLVDHSAPLAVAEALEDSMEVPLDLALRAWRLAVEQIDLNTAAASQVTGFVGQLLGSHVFKPIPFEVWTPTVSHFLTSGFASGTDVGWHNPFLSIIRTRNEVVT